MRSLLDFRFCIAFAKNGANIAFCLDKGTLYKESKFSRLFRQKKSKFDCSLENIAKPYSEPTNRSSKTIGRPS